MAAKKTWAELIGSIDAFAQASQIGHTARFQGRSTNARTTISSALIAAVLNELTIGLAEGETLFKRVEFAALDLTSLLDLKDFGTKFEPLIAFSFQDCTFSGGILAEENALREVELVECSLAGDPDCLAQADSPSVATVPVSSQPPKLSFVGCTIFSKLSICKIRIEAHGALLDLSFTHLERGCSLEDIGPLSVAGTSRSPGSSYPLGHLALEGASVTAGMHLIGVQITSDDCAVMADELTVNGSLLWLNSPTMRTLIKGEIRLMGAHISSQLLFKGVSLHAPREKDRTLTALGAENLTVDGDLFFHGVEKDPDFQGCQVCGILDLISAHIGGDLHFYGTFNAMDRIRAIKARSAVVGGSVHFGWVANEAHRCIITGEADLTNADVKGRVVVGAAVLELTPLLAEKEMKGRRLREYALNFTGASVKNDFRIESGQGAACFIQGLGLMAATIGGRLQLRGAQLSIRQQNVASAANHVEPARRLKERKALSANGAIIHGGITAGRDPFCGQPTSVVGDVRLRNARVDGPVIFKGVTLESTGTKGIAFWATNSHFGSDLILDMEADGDVELPDGSREHIPARFCLIRGEFCLAGSTIDGSLLVNSTTMLAGNSGSALDCYRLNVHHNIFLGASAVEAVPNASVRPSFLFGALNFEFGQAASFTLGSDLVAESQPSEPAFVLYGCMVMRGMEVHGTMMIVDSRFQPAKGLKLSDLDRALCPDLPDQLHIVNVLRRIKRNLELHSVYRSKTVLQAIYAKLGTRMFVRLTDDSSGLMNFFGASTGTIGPLIVRSPSQSTTVTDRSQTALADVQDQEEIKENWGALPSSIGERPALELNLNEFSYTHLNDRKELETKAAWPISRATACRRWLVGWPSREELMPRYDWLERQIDLTHMPGQDGTSPLRQIARVYRDSTNFPLANKFIVQRRWKQVSLREKSDWRKYLDGAFGVFFGFGYSSGRAITTVLLLFGLSYGYVWVGATRQVSAAQSPHRTGLLIDSSKSDFPETDACAFHGRPWSDGPWLHRYGASALEAGKVILPFTRFEKDSGCVLDTGAAQNHHSIGLLLRFLRAMLILVSWIVFPLAAITITGILRESAQ